MTETLAGALLATGLEHDPCLLYGIAHGPSFLDGKRERFLSVNVLAGAGGGDNRDGVPVIRRGNHDRIDIVASQQLAKIFIPLTGRVFSGAYLLAVGKIHQLLCGFPARVATVPVPVARPVHVADARNLYLFFLEELPQMPGPHIARTDESERNAITGRRAAGAAESRCRNNAWQSKPSGKKRTCLQKVASISVNHCFSESVGGGILTEKVTLRKFFCRKRKTGIVYPDTGRTHASDIRTAGQNSERFPRYTHGCPFAHRYGAVPLIKPDSVFVPVQDGPFKTSASPSDRQIGHLREKRRAEALAAPGWIHVDIFQINTGLRQKGGVIVKEKRKAHRSTFKLTDKHLGIRTGSEQGILERFFRGQTFVLKPLESGQSPDERMDKRHIVLTGGPDGKTRKGHPGSGFIHDSIYIRLCRYPVRSQGGRQSKKSRSAAKRPTT